MNVPDVVRIDDRTLITCTDCDPPRQFALLSAGPGIVPENAAVDVRAMRLADHAPGCRFYRPDLWPETPL